MGKLEQKKNWRLVYANFMFNKGFGNEFNYPEEIDTLQNIFYMKNAE